MKTAALRYLDKVEGKVVKFETLLFQEYRGDETEEESEADSHDHVEECDPKCDLLLAL